MTRAAPARNRERRQAVLPSGEGGFVTCVGGSESSTGGRGVSSSARRLEKVADW